MVALFCRSPTIWRQQPAYRLIHVYTLETLMNDLNDDFGTMSTGAARLTEG
jgi:hypothetical protein